MRSLKVIRKERFRAQTELTATPQIRVTFQADARMRNKVGDMNQLPELLPLLPPAQKSDGTFEWLMGYDTLGSAPF